MPLLYRLLRQPCHTHSIPLSFPVESKHLTLTLALVLTLTLTLALLGGSRDNEAGRRAEEGDGGNIPNLNLSL